MTEPLDAYQGEYTPDEDSLKKPVFAVGTAADHRYGVLYQGEHETLWDGTCQAVRLHARALSSTGIPLVLRSFSNVGIDENGIAAPVHVTGIDDVVRTEVGALRNASIGTMLPLIKHLVVRDAEQLKMIIYPRGIVAKEVEQLIRMRRAVADATILYTVWERDRVSPAIVRELSRVAECWVPCSQNRDMLIRSGLDPERVFVMPHPFDPASPICKLTQRKASRKKRYYSIGSWQPRKGFHALIGAFLLAHTSTEDVCLTLKVSGGKWLGYQTPEESVGSWLSDPRVRANGWTMERLNHKLAIINARLPADQILKLHFTNNIYVAAGHGEAWCLPAFDAVCAGNGLVHVPFGGTADFVGAEFSDVVSVPYKLGPVHPSYNWEPDAQWADYTVEDLAQALRAVEPPEEHARSEWFEEIFRLDNVGRMMLERVLHVTEQCNPAAAAYLRSRTAPAT